MWRSSGGADASIGAIGGRVSRACVNMCEHVCVCVSGWLYRPGYIGVLWAIWACTGLYLLIHG